MTKPIYVRRLPLGSGIPKICVPITGRTREEIVEQAKAACDAGADLLEWRVDLWEEADPKKYLEEILFELDPIRKDVPLLFTIRTASEGGRLDVDDAEYSDLNCLAASTGKVDVVDVEALWEPENKKQLIAKLHDAKVPVIASNHDFDKTDSKEELLERFRLLEESGADILKMAVMPRVSSDVETLMQTVKEVTDTKTDKPVIAMSMGQLGAVSRIEGEVYGSCLTFGVVGEASAPGQIPIAQLREQLQEIHVQKILEDSRTIS